MITQNVSPKFILEGCNSMYYFNIFILLSTRSYIQYSTTISRRGRPYRALSRFVSWQRNGTIRLQNLSTILSIGRSNLYKLDKIREPLFVDICDWRDESRFDCLSPISLIYILTKVQQYQILSKWIAFCLFRTEGLSHLHALIDL